jgi:hypothetical protein
MLRHTETNGEQAVTAYHRPFRAKPTLLDGVRYDSKAEANRAAILDMLQRAGEVRWWLRQVTVRLGCPENTYRVDFVVCLKDGRVHGEDVKAIETREFRRQKRLWKAYGPFCLHIIRGGTVEVIDPDGTQ